ncbi:MAG: hypothetical protein N2202_10365, partial [Proteobacteria bacterium]|nr:hypothetical protein [Pseudomonadota bacterium]
MDFIDHISKLSYERKPFIFIIDFEIEKPLVFPTTHLPKNIFFKIADIEKKPITNTDTILDKRIVIKKKPLKYETYLK